MTNEERELVTTARLMYGETLVSISKRTGISEATICRTIKTFELLKAGDFDTLIAKAKTGGTKKRDVEWAAMKLGVAIPNELWSAITQRSRELNEIRERVTPKAAVQPEPVEPPPEAPNALVDELKAIRLEIGALHSVLMTEMKIQTSTLRNINMLLTKLMLSLGEGEA